MVERLMQRCCAVLCGGALKVSFDIRINHFKFFQMIMETINFDLLIFKSTC